MKKLLPVLSIIVLYSCSNEKSESRQIKQYTIEQFYKSTEAFGGSFNYDDSKLLFTSNESGIFNCWETDLASRKTAARTTSTKESIFSNGYVPGTNHILYSADKGGNENSHIYLLKDTTATDLTPGATEKANVFGWSRDQKYLYYTSNLRDARFMDLYKMDTAGWTSSLVYKNETGFDVVAVSDDERYLLLMEFVTTTVANLYIYDRQTKEQKKITADNTNNSGLDFSLDGKSVYFLSDDGSEFTYAVKYGIASGNKEKLYSANWDVVGVAISYNEKYRVVYVNEDGASVIHLFDHQTGKEIEFPKFDDGSIQSVNISRSEKKMRLGVGSSKATSNIYVYDFATKDLKKVTNTLNPEIDENDLVSAQVVRYKSFDNTEIPAIYYKPHQASSKNKVPAIIFVHGGPGGQAGQYYFSLIQFLVNHGYAVLDVNNRGSSGYGKTFFKMDNRNHGDKDLKDIVWGKKYLQSLNYIDSSSIAILGGSYGGYMTLAALCFHPDEFKAGVDLFGVANWLRTLRSIPPYWETFKKALYDEIGDPNTADTVRLMQYSPLLHAGKIKKPLMVLQGANDPRVLKVESDEIVETVKKSNVPVEYIVFPDEGHGFLKKENEIKGYGQILEFLDKYVKPAPATTAKN
ncbi:MAG TPA: alpha/beta fold hydrolase [Chitinophagaceae bacterium]|nr:alpha/beta fold hydrolase [Chitinophagaceae bacterium]